MEEWLAAFIIMDLVTEVDKISYLPRTNCLCTNKGLMTSHISKMYVELVDELPRDRSNSVHKMFIIVEVT